MGVTMYKQYQQSDPFNYHIQYIHYAPYGELIANQSAAGYDERYKFTGKERDEKTGYDYFGARYYVPEIPIWLSVDPLADKYPNISPYAYAAWNPIKYVDPDGRYFDDANEVTAQKIEAECQNKLSSKMLNHFRRKELNKTLKDIADMRNDEKNEYRFELNKDKPGTTGKEEGGRQVITMYSNLERMDGTVAHEVRHGGQVARGEMFWDNMGNPQKYGVRKEVDAYRAQWGWDGYLTVLSDISEFPKEYTAQSYFDIDKDFVNSIMEKLDYLYPPKNPEGELLIDKKTWKKF